MKSLKERIMERLSLLGVKDMEPHIQKLSQRYVDYLVAIGFETEVIGLAWTLARTDFPEQQESVQQIITRDILRDEYPHIRED